MSNDESQENLFDMNKDNQEPSGQDNDTSNLGATDGASDEHIDIINIDDEMKSSYLEYAMSVIVGRALPDARDEVKPSIDAFYIPYSQATPPQNHIKNVPVLLGMF